MALVRRAKHFKVDWVAVAQHVDQVERTLSHGPYSHLKLKSTGRLLFCAAS
jgi:hypothetical protein